MTAAATEDRADPASDRIAAVTWVGAWVAFCALVLHLLLGLDAPLHGDHVFRQAHVLANVDKLLEQGLWSIPGTWNRDLPSLFDLPLQQLLCALLVLASGLEVLAAGRVLGLLYFVSSFWVLRCLLRAHGVGSSTTALTLVLFCAAPIQIFYAGTVLPDGLAVLLTLVALWSHAKWSAGEVPRPWWLAALSSSAALATAIKAPVFMPAAVAILWMSWRRLGTRALVAPGYLLTGAAVLVALLGWHSYASAVNAQLLGRELADLTSASAAWYFGDLADRLDPGLIGRIVRTLTKYLLNPVTSVLAVAALLVHPRGPRLDSTLPPPFAAWLLGCGMMLLVFFNLCWRHSYYLLPCVPPLAWLAARGTCEVLLPRIAAIRWRLSVALLLLGITAGFSVVYAGRLHRTGDVRAERTAGLWIQSVTSPGDFIIWPVVPFDHQPQHLYFAKRNGYMIDPTAISARVLERIHSRHVSPGASGRFLLFVDARLEAQLRDLVAKLDCRRLHRGPPGVLYGLH